MEIGYLEGKDNRLAASNETPQLVFSDYYADSVFSRERIQLQECIVLLKIPLARGLRRLETILL